jgi:hypothetical protein
MPWERKTRNVNSRSDKAMKSFRFSPQSSGDQAEGESLTDFKMKTLGTREGVDNDFQREKQNNAQGKPLRAHSKLFSNL